MSDNRPKMVSCNHLFPGVLFTNPRDNIEWEIMERIPDGEDIPGIGKLDNTRQNKYWCKQVGSKEPLKIVCVDHVLDVEKWKLRTNKAAGEAL